MVFFQFLLGLGAGITIPSMVHQNVYGLLQICFWRPHIKFQLENERRSKDKAIPIESIEAYIKDVCKSSLFFCLSIGPVLYKTYYLEREMTESLGQQNMLDAEDLYVKMLKNQKGFKEDDSQEDNMGSPEE